MLQKIIHPNCLQDDNSQGENYYNYYYYYYYYNYDFQFFSKVTANEKLQE